MPTAGGRSRPRSAISKSACRARCCWSIGMLANKDRDGFLRNFTGLVRRVFGVRIHQDKGVPAEDIAAAAQAAGMPADARRQRRGGARRNRAARLRSAAAHLDHRLALSRGRGAGRERHRAGVTRTRRPLMRASMLRGTRCGVLAWAPPPALWGRVGAGMRVGSGVFRTVPGCARAPPRRASRTREEVEHAEHVGTASQPDSERR